MKAAEFVIKLILYFLVSTVTLFLIERSISAYQRGPEVFDIDSYSFVMAVLFMPLFQFILVSVLALLVKFRPIVFEGRRHNWLTYVILALAIVVVVTTVIGFKTITVGSFFTFWFIANYVMFGRFFINKDT